VTTTLGTGIGAGNRPLARRRPRREGQSVTGPVRARTLMRHFRTATPAIAVLAGGMGEATAARGLIAPCRLALGLAACALRALLAAIAVAPVAVAADHHLAPTTGTIEQTRSAAHRRLLPPSAGSEPTGARYSPASRAWHGLGARYRGDCGGRARCRACLNGPDPLADSRPVVTSRPERTATTAARPARNHPPRAEPQRFGAPLAG
jgi:hypothetical protein